MAAPGTMSIHKLAPFLCAAALGAIVLSRSIDAESIAGADAYHDRVKTAVSALPYRVGVWVGVDVDTTQEAVKLLKPNIILQRLYRDPATGRSFSLLVVHCKDTRDMVGHYPPVCYPAHGWERGDSHMTSFSTGGASSPAMTYEFNRVIQGVEKNMSIFSFFVLPDRRIVADMETLGKVAGTRAASQLGAAQVQIVGGEALSETERKEVIDEFIRAIEPMIRVVSEGVDNG